ncbi:MAG: hypothetical protein MUO23_15325 [Anaerolineales bacterium]|nr:hypothetical protein [Anaerolineales bacterium]
MLHQADSILEDLEDFLLSDLVFWPRPEPRSGGGSRYDLSLGLALLARDSLRAYEQASSEVDARRLRSAAEAITDVMERWAAATSRKARAELPQRLNLWQGYLEEARDTPSSAKEYPLQVRNRVIAERLAPLADPAVSTGQGQRLRLLDQSLNGMFLSGPFVWEEALSPAYPQAAFWFLYGGIRLTPD